jgi:O-antigen/teichoic acid export membrane protein
MKENLVKKFLSFSYGSWFGLVIGFFSTMLTTRILSPQDFGKASMFTLAMNISMIFIIFGTDQSFVRFFYEEKEEKRGGLLYNSLKIPMLLAAILSLIILIFHERLSIFLFEENNPKIIFILVLGVIIQALHRFAVLVIRMQKKGHLYSLLEILNRTVQLILLVFLYFIIGPSYEIVIYSTVLTMFMLSLFGIILEKNYWNYRNIFVKELKHSKLEIFNYAYPLVLTTLITWLFQSFDKIALRHWSDFKELGLFDAAFRLVALLNVVQAVFTTFWTPVVYEHYEKNPKDTSLYERVSKVVAFGMFMIAIFSIMFKDIIIMFLGSEFANSANIMPFLVLMPLMYTISETTVMGINFYKKPKWHILIAIVSCGVNILGNWLLVPRYGAIGAALSTGFSYIVFFSIRTFISLKYFYVNYGLFKIYTLVLLLFIYGLYVINYQSMLWNMLLGFVLMLVTVGLYFKDLKVMYKIYLQQNRKEVSFK